jgi:general secretion pathway protein F
MTAFSYRAISLDSAGTGPQVTGTREAPDERALRESLLAEGLVALDVRPVRVLDAIRASFHPDRPRKADAAWFFQSLRLLLENRVPIESAVRTMGELAPTPRQRRVCTEVREGLRAGKTLADSVAGAGSSVARMVSPHHQALLRSGQQSGRLDHAVALVDTSLQNSARIRRSVVGRLIYPAILIVAAIGVLWFLSARVIPKFAETLVSMGQELPWATNFTLVASRILAWVAPIVVLIVVALWTSRKVWMTESQRMWAARKALSSPVVGTLVWHSEAAFVTDVLATMLEGGADVLAGLEQAERVVGNPVIAERVGAARRAVREGADLGQALADHKVLPPMIGAVVRAGIAGGQLAGALRRATELCLEKQETVSQRLMTLVEPAIILLLAGVVGWVVYSLVTGMLAVTNTAGV